jgi:hypothetical protein
VVFRGEDRERLFRRPTFRISAHGCQRTPGMDGRQRMYGEGAGPGLCGRNTPALVIPMVRPQAGQTPRVSRWPQVGPISTTGVRRIAPPEQ